MTNADLTITLRVEEVQALERILKQRIAELEDNHNMRRERPSFEALADAKAAAASSRSTKADRLKAQALRALDAQIGETHAALARARALLKKFEGARTQNALTIILRPLTEDGATSAGSKK